LTVRVDGSSRAARPSAVALTKVANLTKEDAMESNTLFSRAFLVPTALAAALLQPAATEAASPVDCSDPDNLCTGDPCTIGGSHGVVSPCTVDFGTRTVIVKGKLRVPNGGSLSFTAGSIEVRPTGRLNGSHTLSSAGDGAQISLSSTGNLAVHGVIDASARTTPGMISLLAGGDVDLERAVLRASALPGAATASGGKITVQAGDDLISAVAQRIGKIEATGAATRRRGRTTPGGEVSFSATGSGSLQSKSPIRVQGSTGGTVELDGSAGVTITQSINAAGRDVGGVIEVSGDTIAAVKPCRLIVKGKAGGSVTLSADGDLSVIAVDAKGGSSTGIGGEVFLTSASGNIVTGIANPNHPENAKGRYFVAGGRHGAGGSLLAATMAGNIELLGRFDGRPGGKIEGHAEGDLTAEGKFQVAPGGCIGLSATGTLTTAGDFDTTVTPSCP
jgi:hypothetical protein